MEDVDELLDCDGRTLPRVRELKHTTCDKSKAELRRTLPRVRELKLVAIDLKCAYRDSRTLPRVRELKLHLRRDKLILQISRTLPRVRELKLIVRAASPPEIPSHPSQGA